MHMHFAFGCFALTSHRAYSSIGGQLLDLRESAQSMSDSMAEYLRFNVNFCKASAMG